VNTTAIIASVTSVGSLIVAALVAWVGYKTYKWNKTKDERELARQNNYKTAGTTDVNIGA
jgi:hypothetical protein